ncbi:MAG TPA: tetratricopeptide repeat protein, partial [Candidatus Manganitrophaceae bacterium]|nr:tetratricopeptide repeat protein [Candidatus Manganitrophaceae bacterium]
MSRFSKKIGTFFLLSLLALPAACSRQIRPDAVGPTHLEEGLIAYEQNRWDEALQQFDAALKIDPQNTEALFRRGIIFQKQNKIDDAIAAYRELIRIDPNHFKSHYNLGNLYSYEKGNNTQAIFHYRRFADLAPTHPLNAKTQARLAELTGPDEKLARGKSTLEGEPQSDIHLTGELTPPTTAALPAVLPAAPVAVVPPASRAEAAPPVPAPAERNDPSYPQVVCVIGETARGKIEGSGFVIGSGYILASGHETDQSHRLAVRFQDGSIQPATLLSVSSALDLALLQIPAAGTAPLSFSNANSGKVGETVVAVGCPFGLDHSASQGIISAPERLLGDRPLIQTDVAVNPGNSGGPLLNKQGEVIGVVLGMIPEARGIAFAVPAREAKRFLGETFFQMGTLLAEAKRYSEAAELLAQSTKFSPQSAKAFNNLGEVYRRSNEAKKAEQAYLKAIEINPKYADAHYNLGTLYDGVIRNPKKAAHHYRKYMELKPASPDTV